MGRPVAKKMVWYYNHVSSIILSIQTEKLARLCRIILFCKWSGSSGWAGLLQKRWSDTTTIQFIQRTWLHMYLKDTCAAILLRILSLRIIILHYQVWSYLHSTFGGSPAVTKLQACQYCLAAAHAEQVVILKPDEALQLLTRWLCRGRKSSSWLSSRCCTARKGENVTRVVIGALCS